MIESPKNLSELDVAADKYLNWIAAFYADHEGRVPMYIIRVAFKVGAAFGEVIARKEMETKTK